MSMEDIREANFRKIQQILDRCVAHEYGMKTSALALKREYLTEEQICGKADSLKTSPLTGGKSTYPSNAPLST